MGLQSRGDRRDGTQGKTALFALWGANASVGPRDAVCKAFDNEGSGHSCITAEPTSYTWTEYFSPKLSSCTAQPYSLVQWGAASGNNGSGEGRLLLRVHLRRDLRERTQHRQR